MKARRFTRHTLRTGYRSKNKFSQNEVRSRRVNSTLQNKPNRPNMLYYQKFRKNRLQSVQNMLDYNRNSYRSPRLNYNYNHFPSIAKPNNKLFYKTIQNDNPNYDKRIIYVKGLPRFVDNK